MRKKRVLIIGGANLLGAAVESLLARVKRLEIVCSTEGNSEAIFSAIEQVHPDVIILEDRLLNLIVVDLMAFLDNYPTLRVIALNVESNTLVVFDRRQLPIQQSNDLIAAI